MAGASSGPVVVLCPTFIPMSFSRLVPKIVWGHVVPYPTRSGGDTRDYCTDVSRVLGVCFFFFAVATVEKHTCKHLSSLTTRPFWSLPLLYSFLAWCRWTQGVFEASNRIVSGIP
ncbi:hypothetical protein BKA83DRAFT_4215501, partial [Pisolithus microcarpus]